MSYNLKRTIETIGHEISRGQSIAKLLCVHENLTFLYVSNFDNTFLILLMFLFQHLKYYITNRLL